jgi:hypothetical protein
MGSLRAKLGAPPLIENVRGIGYRLAVPAEAVADPGPPALTSAASQL